MANSTTVRMIVAREPNGTMMAERGMNGTDRTG
jgi:hypothetical protein